MLNFLKRNKFLASLFFLIIFLRLPSLFEPYWYGDEGIYLTIGQGIKKGLVLYKDIFDNKPPLIYFLSALASNIFWFRFFLLVSCLLSCFLFIKIADFFLKKEFWFKITSLAFVLLLNIPLAEGNIANAEIFQLPLTLGAIYLFFKILKKGGASGNKKDYFLIGILFSVAVLFKIPAIFDFLALVLFLFLEKSKKHSSIFFSLVIGFFLPLIITVIYFLRCNYLKNFIEITFFQNLGYLSSWQTGSHQISLIKSGVLQKFTFLVIILLFLLWKSRKEYGKPIFFVQIWFLFDLFSCSLSGRPYAHYLIQILPSLSFLLGFLGECEKNRFKLTAILVIFLFYLIKIKPWFYPVSPYYQNFFQFIFKVKTKTEYFSFFDQKVPKIYEISFFVKKYTKSTDKIFVWADEPQIYALSKRLPVSRYVVAYHIIDFKKFSETIEYLQKNPPKIIVLDKNKKEVFKELESLIASNYYKVKIYDNFEIYRTIE